MPADSADTQSAPVRSETFPPAVQSQWWLLLEEPGRSLCDFLCGQCGSGWDQDPSVLALGEYIDRVAVRRGHLHSININVSLTIEGKNNKLAGKQQRLN